MTLVREYQPTFVLGDGETKEFSYLFEEVSENFIKVIVKHSDDSTYVPVFSVDLDSHKVVFGESETAPLDTDLVCIYRETPDLQDTPFRTLQGYDAKALENILSKIVAMIQELKANGFSTQILQGTPWQLDLLHPADDGASIVVDYNARILKKGLYFQLVGGNLQVSVDGNSFISMPKSADVAEFRQKEIIKEDLSVEYLLQYRVGDKWFDIGSTGRTAEDAILIAEEAKEIAEEAKEIAVETKNLIIIRSSTIPTASADLLGKAYQYSGTTNGQYTHNYIYECVAGETTYTGIIGFDPAKIAFDYTKGEPATFFSEITPNFPQITHGTFTYDIAGNIWTIVGKDSNENVIFDNYRLYTEDLEDAGFVFINPPQDYTDGEVIDFTITFTPQPTTYSWVRVDVQPDRIAEIQALENDVDTLESDIATLENYDYVVDFQAPTAENNYTWYRKYKSGWVEQGGTASSTSEDLSVTLPVTMANNNYQVLLTLGNTTKATFTNQYWSTFGWRAKTTTGFTCTVNVANAGTKDWYVYGMSAS